MVSLPVRYHGVDELRIPKELWDRIEATRREFERTGAGIYKKLDHHGYLIHLLDVAVGSAERELKRRELAGRKILTPDEAARLDWEGRL